MGQVAGLSGNNYSNFGFQQQQDPSMMMGFALMSAFLSNDPGQMMQALGTLAQSDPRSFLMFLGMMNPQLFQQLAQSLMGPQAGGGTCPSCGGGGGGGGGGVPLSDMIMNNLLNNRSQGGDCHVVPPRNRQRSFQPGQASPSNLGAQGTADIGGARNLSAEQKRNAQTIIDVGHQKGASERDIQIALMTSMQESNLRNLNYGDRDSVGLFQQRPSCGWGSVAQCTNPQYAAGKFYDGLLALRNRDSMSLTQAAQSVQRSAFPNAYAKWEGVARGLIGELDGGKVA